MFRAKARVLLGIALVGSTAVVTPEAAIAAGMCSSGSVSAGGMQSYSYNLDSSLRAQFTLDTTATDVAMQVVDDSNNVACQTALPNPGHQSCGWTPVSGVTYTVNVLRAAATPTVDPAAVQDDPAAMTNIGQGADTSGDNSAANSSSSTDQGNGDSWHHHSDQANQDGNASADPQTASTDTSSTSSDSSSTDSSASSTATADATPPAPPADFSLCYLQVN